jgi:hypothetical protein
MAITALFKHLPDESASEEERRSGDAAEHHRGNGRV